MAPQHFTAEDTIAQTCSGPFAIAVTPCSNPAMTVGFAELEYRPLPNLPPQLSPQHLAAPPTTAQLGRPAPTDVGAPPSSITCSSSLSGASDLQPSSLENDAQQRGVAPVRAPAHGQLGNWRVDSADDPGRGRNTLVAVDAAPAPHHGFRRRARFRSAGRDPEHVRTQPRDGDRHARPGRHPLPRSPEYMPQQ